MLLLLDTQHFGFWHFCTVFGGQWCFYQIWHALVVLFFCHLSTLASLQEKTQKNPTKNAWKKQ